MLFLVNNDTLIRNRERTFLTASANATDTSINVQAVDANVWSDNDWLIVGEIGSPNAEVVQINGTPTNGTSLTIDNAGSGGLRYDHAADEPVYRIDFNQIEFSRAAQENGSKTVLTTIDLQPSDYESRYDDQQNTNGFGFVRFKNSETGGFSQYSDAMPYGGQSLQSLSKLRRAVRRHLDEEDDRFISDADIDEELNLKQREIIQERMWVFNETEKSLSSVANQIDYEYSDLVKTIHTISFNTQPVYFIDRSRWDELHYDSDMSAETPQGFNIWNNKLRFYPRPDTDAHTTLLDGNITDSDTTIMVDSVAGFERGDYFRFVINDEVIYATASDTDTNTFSGCLRGQEGTTASAHTHGDIVTERNIVYTGQLYATPLVDENDETVIPEPDVLSLGAAAELARGKLRDVSRGDRLELKFQGRVNDLRKSYTIKQTGQFARIKTAEEKYSARFHNPNDYPQNLQAL